MAAGTGRSPLRPPGAVAGTRDGAISCRPPGSGGDDPAAGVVRGMREAGGSALRVLAI